MLPLPLELELELELSEPDIGKSSVTKKEYGASDAKILLSTVSAVSSES